MLNLKKPPGKDLDFNAIIQSSMNHRSAAYTGCLFAFISRRTVAECHKRNNRDFLRDILKPFVNVFPQKEKKRKKKKTVKEDDRGSGSERRSLSVQTAAALVLTAALRFISAWR